MAYLVSYDITQTFEESSITEETLLQFAKELYKKVKCDVDTRDKAEVFIAFLCNMLYTRGIYVTPCGSAWFHIWDDSKMCETYREMWMPVYQAYIDWQLKQR